MAIKATYTHTKAIENYWKGPWVSYRIKGSRHACRGAREKTAPSISEVGVYGLFSDINVTPLQRLSTFVSQ